MFFGSCQHLAKLLFQFEALKSQLVRTLVVVVRRMHVKLKFLFYVLSVENMAWHSICCTMTLSPGNQSLIATESSQKNILALILMSHKVYFQVFVIILSRLFSKISWFQFIFRCYCSSFSCRMLPYLIVSIAFK